MRQSLQQSYRHLVQQQIVRQIMASQKTWPKGWNNGAWEISGLFALFSAAAVCGALAQIRLG